MSDNILVTDQDLPKDIVEEMEVDDNDADAKETGEETTNDDSNELEFRTPESEKNKIPVIENCPPPPEKPRKTRFGRADSPEPEPEMETVMEMFDSCTTEDSEMDGPDGRFSLKKRLFVDTPPVNDKKE
ncbi:PREDICTED: uncharacterized protein LOC109192932 [Ipomoea nil]|uniref:uncharacterized protein LOC109192932 n=1 Tax=Ipomoea nil TaxID=35883 RepID=UPI000901E35D|nr:PREDICTED: uncharacterized protein LOC109192932 [Ipomoea nil]